MADFTSATGIASNLNSALSILGIFRNIYEKCMEVEKILSWYNTDAAFKTEADHLFTAEQIAEIADMITDVQGIKSDWAENHIGPLGL